MNNLQKIMAYLCKNYPYKDELSNARLTKMVYLADWYNVCSTGQQLTDIEWYFDNYGPFVHDVLITAGNTTGFQVVQTTTMYGTPKIVIGEDPENKLPEKIALNDNTQKILDKVIQNTKDLNWNQFISFVYHTPPIQQSNRYSTLEMNQFI